MKSKGKTLSLLSLLFFLPSCASIHHKDVNYGYGTYWTYHLFEGDRSVLDGLMQKVVKTSFLCDPESLDAEEGVAQINTKNHAKPALFLQNCLKFAEEMREKTSGYFSPCSGGLTSLWLSSLKKGEVPSKEKIEEEVAKTSTYLIFDGDEVTKVGEGLLDLGGIGKGYCADELKGMLNEKGITKYWVSGGNSSIIFGDNPNGKDGYTKVELNDLPGKYVYCKNQAISTSSCSEQLYVVDGKRYSHIVNPFTGSAEVNLEAVIVRGDSAAVCDALSTAIYLEGVASISKYEKEFDVEVIAVKDGKAVYCTDGFKIEG